MTTMETNGKLRKSLADQIDRLDGILDGLADALNESVTAAVKDAVGLAVREAVQAVLTELLANPAVLALVAGNTAAAVRGHQPAARVPLASRLCGWAGRLGRAAGDRIRTAAAACAAGVRTAGRGVAACWCRLRLLRSFRLPLLLALGVGAVTAVAAYHAGPWLASVTSGLGSFAATLAVQLLARLRRLLAGPLFGGA